MKISDLKKTLTGDKTYLKGIKIIEGEFLRTFKEGIPLIPDEINSASQEVLQCIEGALNSQTINIEMPSIGHSIEENTQKYQLNQNDKIFVFSKGLIWNILRLSKCLRF